MFLRAENDTAEVRARVEAMDARAHAIAQRLAPIPSPADARERLELAGIYCWQGKYRPTKELLEPLTGPEYLDEIRFNAMQMLGDNHYRHDQYDLASRRYHSNFDFALESGRLDWQARAEDGIAWVLVDVGHYSSGEFEEAHRIFSKNLAIHRQFGNWAGECMGIYGLSRATAGTGKYGPAIELAHQSIEALRGHGGEVLTQLPLLQLANVYRDRGNFDEAILFYEQATRAADQSQDPYTQALVANDYGLLLRFQSNVDGAISVWRSVLGMVKECEFPRLGHEICSRLAGLFAEQRDFENAYTMQMDCQKYGSRVGVMASVLHNQQMLLWEQMHQTMQLEDALKDLRAGVAASIDGIFVLEILQSGIDKDELMFRFVNEAAARMLGRSPDLVNHIPIRSIWKSSRADLLLAPSREVFESGEPRTVEAIELDFLPGESGRYSVKIAKVPHGVVWTVSDVTEREAMQGEIVLQHDRLKEANAQLVALDREKSDMLGVAAHDLRSPIGNIRSLCELVSIGGAESLELVETIGEIADSLLQLIGNILDVEKLDRGELELDLGEVDLVGTTARLVEYFTGEACQKGIQLQTQIPAKSILVWADGSAVSRILQNLISNAVKFSPPGRPVMIRVTETAEAARIEITDQGAGITEADRQRLFGKFSRLSARPTAGESSTGLGLSIVKRLVEALGGAVGCDSESGHGATFWVNLPTPQAHHAAA